MTWMLFILDYSNTAAMYLVAIIWSGLIRLPYIRLLYASHVVRVMIRTLVLTPVPSRILVDWCFNTYIAMPFILYGLGTAMDRERRSVFLLQRRLLERASTLQHQLQAAERALAFEVSTLIITLATATTAVL